MKLLFEQLFMALWKKCLFLFGHLYFAIFKDYMDRHHHSNSRITSALRINNEETRCLHIHSYWKTNKFLFAYSDKSSLKHSTILPNSRKWSCPWRRLWGQLLPSDILSQTDEALVRTQFSNVRSLRTWIRIRVHILRSELQEDL